MANKRFLILDTESNGVATDAEVWQIAWQITDCHFQTIKVGGGYLTPIDRMRPKAKDITGLDRKTLKKVAEPADDLYERLVKDLRGCKAVIGHSIDMDILRLTADAKRRCSGDVSGRVITALNAMPQYDTMAHTIRFVGKVIYKDIWFRGHYVLLSKRAFPSLEELAAKLKVERQGIKLHSADGDVELTRRCMAAMKQSHRELLEDLIAGDIINPSKYYNWVPCR